MERAFSAPTEAPPHDLYRVVADLATYPHWLVIVDTAEAIDPTGDGGGDEPAWMVTLRARIGPFARSKRLRMVRTVDDGRRVHFERREIDGRDHSSWTLAAEVHPLDDERHRSEVHLDLRYGGALWSGLLDGVLQSAADEATERLQAYVSSPR